MTIWTIPNIKVLKLAEAKQHIHLSGHGDAALFEDRSIGWFVQLEGSYESLFLGKDKPDLEVGDTVDITIRKRSKS